ncbi:MAG: polyamine ABC transporter substrate-binding protein [Snowella sp.]|jgi:putative spermidine/putrescine transport system substrate-binding protein|nr:MAG: polyamine ABC transporter substrate-binding protein [Snowella sp.]
MSDSLPLSQFNRRSFLLGAGAIVLGQGLLGCDSSSSALQVLFLKNSISAQLISRFTKKTISENKLTFKAESQLKTIFKLLQAWQQSPTEKSKILPQLPVINPAPPAIANLVTTGDAWLADAIAKQLIEPLNVSGLSNWPQLAPRWHKLVQRNDEGFPDDQGKTWGAPYRWGTTLIVYRKDKFKQLGWTPKNWEDLWRKELEQRISIVDQPREVIGLTLKKLGDSYNPTALNNLPQLRQELVHLHQQIKFYSSTRYLQPLLVGDVWCAIGWSNEILPLLKNNPNLAAVVPESGTSLWADLWVQPKSSSSNPLLTEWLDFCWQPDIANQIAFFRDGVSPRLETLDKNMILPQVRDNPLLMIPPQLLDRCEFLLPLSPKVQQQFLDLWQELRAVSRKS